MSDTDETIAIKVITPKGLGLDTTALFCKLCGDAGDIGVLPNHSPSLAVLKPGELQFKLTPAKDDYYFVSEGIAHITTTSVTLLVPYIEKLSDISRNRAKEAKERALKRLDPKYKDEDNDSNRANLSLKRAMARLEMYDSHHHI